MRSASLRPPLWFVSVILAMVLARQFTAETRDNVLVNKLVSSSTNDLVRRAWVVTPCSLPNSRAEVTKTSEVPTEQ